MTSRTPLDIRISSRAGVTIVTLRRFLDAAVAAARQPPPRRITRIRLAPTPHSAATARRVVAATCQVWDCSELVEDASAVASELVANAVRHAGTDAELRLELRRGLLTVAITDGNPSPPRLHPADELAPSGHGLRIVDSLSRAWGWVPTSSGGKIVWAVLRNSPERRSNGRVATSR